MATLPTSGTEVLVYSNGIVCCSVCAPATMSPTEVASEVNRMHPTGIQSEWALSSDPTFADGKLKNGCPCDSYPEERRHWLLNC